MTDHSSSNGISRRTMLASLSLLAAPATLADEATDASEGSVSIDVFLAMSSAAERVRYHSNELLQALEEMHPKHPWRSQIDHELCFAFFTPRFNEVRS
jgi:hypothetical protein